MAEAGELSDWTRTFAQDNLIVFANPSVEQIREAVAAHLSDKLGELSSISEAEELLEKALGIAVIVEFGKERIGWTAAPDPDTANALKQLYSSEAYSKARHALGIDSLWIFQVKLELLDVYFEEDLIERAPYPLEMYEKFPDVLRLEDRQECVIVEL